DSKIIKRLRKIHRERFFSSPQPDRSAKTDNPPATEAEAYRCLRAYHCDILNRMDLIHFNSTLSREIYSKYITPVNGVVLPVSRNGIRDLREQTGRSGDNGKCTIVYLASMKPYKGFTILQQALDELWSEGIRSFELLVFSRTDRISPYLKCHEEGYNRAQLNEILQQADVLVAPSIWYETYGFTVLEALSHGVPVIVSDHVGAKDLVNGFGSVVPAGDVSALKEAVRDCIADMGSITKKKMAAQVVAWEQFVDDCYALYREDDRKCRTVL
ncbi:MAG: glycosyltransferase family 4 protein, partial [Lachnospiraceae bacterium]|nr:glycosyltransferase family 4 protein [Lachnospiraceae bacterium]